MASDSVDVLFLDFSIVHHITVLLHFSIYQASVWSTVECLVYASLGMKEHFIFLLIIILFISSLSVA